jgi:hypothetical protein
MPLVEHEIRLPAGSPVPATLVVVIVERRPGRFRAWVAKLLVRLAGRVASMRVRIEVLPP